MPLEAHVIKKEISIWFNVIGRACVIVRAQMVSWGSVWQLRQKINCGTRQSDNQIGSILSYAVMASSRINTREIVPALQRALSFDEV